jgi:hypothetical protein
MPSDKGSQGTAATVLREAARHLIASMDALPDRVQKRRLAEQAFELLRQAAKLDEEEKETLDPQFPSDIDCSPGLERGQLLRPPVVSLWGGVYPGEPSVEVRCPRSVALAQLDQPWQSSSLSSRDRMGRRWHARLPYSSQAVPCPAASPGT